MAHQSAVEIDGQEVMPMAAYRTNRRCSVTKMASGWTTKRQAWIHNPTLSGHCSSRLRLGDSFPTGTAYPSQESLRFVSSADATLPRELGDRRGRSLLMRRR